MNLSHSHLLGTAPNGTPAYSNQWDSTDKGNNFQKDSMGNVMHQCVGYARRWLFDAKALYLPDIQIAAQIFFIDHVFDLSGAPVRARGVRNGTCEKPQKDAFIIYAGRIGNFVGHIGVIVDVTDDRVFVADQNRYNKSWGVNHYSASFEVKYDKKQNTWSIVDDEEPVIGWVVFENSPNVPLSTTEAANEPVTPASPKIAERSDKTDLTLRKIPAGFLVNLPKYSDDEKSQWMRLAISEFSPSAAAIPFWIAGQLLCCCVPRAMMMAAWMLCC